MESLLNILWVLIAVAALSVWRLRWIHEERPARRKPAQEWTAMGCALVLLFFAVSLTDDLHSEILLYDECASGRRHSLLCAYGHSAAHGANSVRSAAVARLPRTVAFEAPRLGDWTVTQKVEHEKAVTFDLAFGRAPPAWLL